MSKIVKSILMAQAPERPTWFRGHSVSPKPVEPSRSIEKYKGNKSVENLLKSWLEDSVWDLANTFISAKEVPEGTEFRELQEELSKFEQIWDNYREELAVWNRERDLKLDIQWRVYWAEKAYVELNTPWKQSKETDNG